ncbi:MAG: nucleotide exchange factor GrpE [Chloroflexi bacterium]|nr:nucleotide exchange factor GrpE [Chloroflexota bacterium]
MPNQSKDEANADKAQAPAQEANNPLAEEKPVEDAELLKQQLEEEKTKVDDYLKHWQRTQADFINYKRRTEQERAELLKFSNASLILKILPVLDDFDRAFSSLPREIQHMTWLDGIALIDRKLRFILEQEGVTPIEALGKEFDPTQHEAVLFEEGADPQHGKVVAELQKGYKLHDRVIRPTLVKVGQTPPEAPGNEASGKQGGDRSE